MHRAVFPFVLSLFTGFTVTAQPATFDAAKATNQVGVDLFRELRAGRTDANIVLSPYSIESALALAYAGADGDTRAEMARVLRLPSDQPVADAGFRSLRDALHTLGTSHNSVRRAPASGAIEWHVANRLFGQRTYEFRPAFLQLMREGYDAPLEPMDFRRAPDAARSHINDWVADQTRGKISEVVPRGGISADTRLVLVNALYLKARWSSPFSASATRRREFHRGGAGDVSVPMMRQTSYYGYARQDGFTIVTVPYAEFDLELLIVLPDEATGLESVVKALTADQLSRWASLVHGTQVDLSLPKLRIEPPIVALATMLQRLGVQQAFDMPRGSANFSRMADRKSDYLALSEVYHRVFVAMDEQGTEAAAASAAGLTLGMAAVPQKPIEVRVDHPFAFAIRHRPTGVCLFLGQITDPR